MADCSLAVVSTRWADKLGQSPNKSEDVQFVRRATFLGRFTQRVSMGKGLNTGQISARYDNGVLELSVPYAPEIQRRR